MTTVTFPVQSAAEAAADTEPAPCGTIPSIAQAYSLNLTLVPAAGGHVDYVSLWPSGYPQPYVSTLDDVQGLIVSNAAIVPAGTVNAIATSKMILDSTCRFLVAPAKRVRVDVCGHANGGVTEAFRHRCQIHSIRQQNRSVAVAQRVKAHTLR
jgi:hypothetical protein